MTLIFDKAQKQLLSLQIASYMDDPKDAMTLTVEFSRLPDGTNTYKRDHEWREQAVEHCHPKRELPAPLRHEMPPRMKLGILRAKIAELFWVSRGEMATRQTGCENQREPE